MNSKSKKISPADIAYVSAAAALITVCAWISIPAAVSFTLQTFAVFLVLGVLGGARGAAAVAVYVAMGALGLPVFAGFKGGVGALLGMTGGYIFGFIFSAGFYWLVTALRRDSLPSRIIGSVGGLLICYALGTAWFVAVYTRENGAITVASALSMCVLPFLPFDAIKLALAVPLAAAVKKRLPRATK